MRFKTGVFFLLLLGACFFIPHHAWAQAVTFDMGAENGTVTGRIVQLLAILTVLSLAPSILIMMTAFTRVVVVLSFLRTAIGIQQTPPNTVMISLALFLTFFIMAPTIQKSYVDGIRPLMQEEMNEIQAFDAAIKPFHDFMGKHVRPADLELFIGMSQKGQKNPVAYKNIDAVPIHVLIPAFMISELRRAFEIGFLMFLPFLIIDMVTASILMSMGMMMLPPVMISLPFKIIFFVVVDGWHLLSGSLVQSFDSLPAGVGG
jgi:flagellar biosynthetic protein FliP